MDKTQITVILHVTPCSLADGYQHLRKKPVASIILHPDVGSGRPCFYIRHCENFKSQWKKYDMIWYDIFVNCNWVVTRWQYTFTHKQYIEQYKTNNTYNNTTILEEAQQLRTTQQSPVYHHTIQGSPAVLSCPKPAESRPQHGLFLNYPNCHLQIVSSF